MNLEEYNKKLAELKTKGLKLAQEGKLDEAEKVKAECEALAKSFEAEKAEAAEENAVTPQAVPKEMQNNTEVEEKRVMSYTAESAVYKTAYLKNLVGRDMNAEENDAYKLVNAETTTTAAPVMPTTMVNQIWDLIKENHAIVGDLNTLKTQTVLEVPVVKAISAGKGKKTAENTANDELTLTKAKVTLSGNDFTAFIDLSYAAMNMALPALESYIVTEIAATIGDAIADDAVTTITGAIASANSIAVTGTLKYANVAAAFGALKRVSSPVVYVTRSTLFNKLATLEDTAGHLIFVPDANTGAEAGRLLGATVKIEDSVGDDKILVGDGKRVINNIVTDVMVETDKDIKTHTITYSGYERSQCALVDDQSFALITITAGS